MEREVALAQGKPGAEDWMLDEEAFVLAYSGHLQAGQEDVAAGGGPGSAGGPQRKRRLCTKPERRCGKLSSGMRPRRGGARWRRLSFPRTGMWSMAPPLPWPSPGIPARSQTLADDLEKRFPEDTSVRFSYLPALRALLALNHGEPPKAIELLQVAVPYELGAPRSWFGFFGALYPVYVRGRGLSGRAPRRRSRRGIPENSRSPRDRCQRSHRRTGALATRQSVRFVGR